jgi:hypothetical protein
MDQTQKLHLPLILNKIMLKRSLMFFKNLVLFEEDTTTSKHVRHYDLECEGIMVLNGFFTMKCQHWLMRAFNEIKNKDNHVRKPLLTERKGITGRTKIYSRQNTSFE